MVVKERLSTQAFICHFKNDSFKFHIRSINNHQQKNWVVALAQITLSTYSTQVSLNQISHFGLTALNIVCHLDCELSNTLSASSCYLQMVALRIPSIAMLLPIMICLFIATANSMNTTTFNLLLSAFASNNTSSALLAHPSTSNATIFAPLAAPLYRNVTAGDAWVFPSSPNDLGARDMSCECFNPGGELRSLEYGAEASTELKKRPMLYARLLKRGSFLHADRLYVLRGYLLRGGRILLWGFLLYCCKSSFPLLSLFVSASIFPSNCENSTSDTNRTPSATSKSLAPDAALPAPSASVLPPATITPHQIARNKLPHRSNAVPPIYRSVMISIQADWAAMPALRPRLRRPASRA